MWKGEYPCVSTSAMRLCLCVIVCLCRLACITGLRGGRRRMYHSQADRVKRQKERSVSEKS